MRDSDLQEIKKALGVARRKGMQTVKLAEGEVKFSAVLRPSKQSRTAPTPESTSIIETTEPEQPAIKAPLVGYFRFSDQPIEAGSEIEEGTIIGSIVALELANEIRMPQTATISDVNVSDGQPVEYGQTILTYRA